MKHLFVERIFADDDEVIILVHCIADEEATENIHPITGADLNACLVGFKHFKPVDDYYVTFVDYNAFSLEIRATKDAYERLCSISNLM